jgi:hypothetical protein
MFTLLAHRARYANIGYGNRIQNGSHDYRGPTNAQGSKVNENKGYGNRIQNGSPFCHGPTNSQGSKVKPASRVSAT